MSTREEFRVEAMQILGELSKDLLSLRQVPEDPDPLNRVFRGAHSLKGLAAMVGFTNIRQTAHGLETAVDAVRMGRLEADGPLLDLLKGCSDLLLKLVDAAATGGPEPDMQVIDKVAQRLSALPVKACPSAESRLRPNPDLVKSLTEYEARRAGLALDRGQRLWRLEVMLPFETFERDLPALIERLKGNGEVIATLAGDLTGPHRLGFALIVASEKDPATLLRTAEISDARLVEVPVHSDPNLELRSR